jgi:hypothetical protein
MNKEFLNVNEIKEYTTLSHRQIRNNLNGLKNTNQFEELIIGGGKGKGGTFWIHYSIIPKIVRRQRKRVNKVTLSTIKDRRFSEYYYTINSWDYFGCIHPNKDIDYSLLKNSLNNFNSFYVIHRRNEIHHIHFTIQSSLVISEIKELLKSYFKRNNVSIDEVFLTEFNKGYREDTLNYLLRRGKHSSKKDLIDWGLNT